LVIFKMLIPISVQSQFHQNCLPRALH
jgi:hypothetical protein